MSELMYTPDSHSSQTAFETHALIGLHYRKRTTQHTVSL